MMAGDMSVDSHYSIETITKYYGEALSLYGHVEFNATNCKSFKNRLDDKFALYGLLDKEENEALTYSVLKDQQDEKTKANVFDIYALKEKYKHLNKKILEKEPERIL